MRVDGGGAVLGRQDGVPPVLAGVLVKVVRVNDKHRAVVAGPPQSCAAPVAHVVGVRDARRAEAPEQREQVRDVDEPVAVDILRKPEPRAALGAKGREQREKVGDVHIAVAVDVLRARRGLQRKNRSGHVLC